MVHVATTSKSWCIDPIVQKTWVNLRSCMHCDILFFFFCCVFVCGGLLTFPIRSLHFSIAPSFFRPRFILGHQQTTVAITVGRCRWEYPDHLHPTRAEPVVGDCQIQAVGEGVQRTVGPRKGSDTAARRRGQRTHGKEDSKSDGKGQGERNSKIVGSQKKTRNGTGKSLGDIEKKTRTGGTGREFDQIVATRERCFEN